MNKKAAFGLLFCIDIRTTVGEHGRNSTGARSGGQIGQTLVRLLLTIYKQKFSKNYNH